MTQIIETSRGDVFIVTEKGSVLRPTLSGVLSLLYMPNDDFEEVKSLYKINGDGSGSYI